MSQLPPANQAPEGTTPVYQPAFETAVQSFWAKNRQVVLILVAVALLAIVGREAWQYVAASREDAVRADYAKAGDQSAKLESFASANSGHALAGVAYLRIADEKFTTGDYKNAAAAYQKAAGSLKDVALVGRARVGAAVSQLNSGDQAGGEAALKGVSADASLTKGARAEATYDLAALAADAGKADEVKKLADEISKIDGGGSWAQRATLLVMRQPGGTKPANAAAPSLSFKPGGN